MSILVYLYPLFLALGMLHPVPMIQDMPEVQIEAVTVAPAVPGTNREYIGMYYTTWYYSPLGNQDRYYNGRTYEKDVCKNCGCGGDCFHTASGYELTAIDELAIVACPSTFDFWEVLEVEGLGRVVCMDRGGSIKGRRLDIWNGIGAHGLENIERGAFKDGEYKVYKIR